MTRLDYEISTGACDFADCTHVGRVTRIVSFGGPYCAKHLDVARPYAERKARARRSAQADLRAEGINPEDPIRQEQAAEPVQLELIGDDQ